MKMKRFFLVQDLILTALQVKTSELFKTFQTSFTYVMLPSLLYSSSSELLTLDILVLVLGLLIIKFN